MVYKYLYILVLLIHCQNPNPKNTALTKPDEPEKIETIDYIVKSGQFKYGDTLERILQQEALDRNVSHKIITSFSKVFNVRHIKPGKTYNVLFDSSGVVHGFEYHAEKALTIKVIKDSTDSFIAHEHQRPLNKVIESIHGTIQSSLYDAIRETGETPELIIMFSDIFQWDIDFFIDPRTNDTFDILFEKYYVQNDSSASSGEFIRYGRILAGRYTFEDTSLTAIYFDNKPGDSGYYDLMGRSFQKTFLKSPLNYRRISSYFSGARRHPILKIVRAHYAVDFAAPLGTPVSAAGDGTIIEIGYGKGIGNYIKICHKNPRFVTLYGHLNGFASGMKKGLFVKQKDVIGYVGKTGLATGPHLHYAFYENGKPINPLKIKNTSGDPILEENKPRFDKIKNKRLRQLEEKSDLISLQYINKDS